MHGFLVPKSKLYGNQLVHTYSTYEMVLYIAESLTLDACDALKVLSLWACIDFCLDHWSIIQCGSLFFMEISVAVHRFQIFVLCIAQFFCHCLPPHRASDCVFILCSSKYWKVSKKLIRSHPFSLLNMLLPSHLLQKLHLVRSHFQFQNQWDISFYARCFCVWGLTNDKIDLTNITVLIYMLNCSSCLL